MVKPVQKVLFKSPNPQQVIAAVGACFGLFVNELIHPGASMQISYYRQLAMFLARRHTKLSYPKLAMAFHRKDHTTIMYGVGRITERSKTSTKTTVDIERVEALLRERGYTL